MKKKTKILFVTHLFYPAIGGVELHLKNLTKEFVKRGFQVKVLTADAYTTEAFFMGDKRRMDKKETVIDGVEVERLGYRTWGSGLLTKLRHLACRFNYPFNDKIRAHSFGPRNRKFVDKIIEYNPDIIYAAPLPTLNVHYAHKAAKILKKPLIIIPSYHIYDPCGFYNRQYFRIMQEADLIMAQSPMEKDFLAREGGIDHHKIIILPPLPLRLEQMQPEPQDPVPIRRRYGIKEKYVVLYLGQQGYHKKVEDVLGGMRYVWQSNKDVALVIAGGVTGQSKKLHKLADELKETLDGNTYFIDNFPIQDKESIFQMADVFICLSELESFGIVFVEALNCGLPIIASKNSVARYIVDEFQTGLLVEPNSHTEVAAAIHDILDTPDMRLRYSKNARQKAYINYHPTVIVDTWEKEIEKILREHDQHHPHHHQRD